MSNQNNTIWTEEMISAMTEMWKTMSAGAIADDFSVRFGLHLTRNSVVGKLHRLGLTSSNKSADAPQRVRPPRSTAPKVNRSIMRLVRTASKTNGLRLVQTTTSDMPLFECVVEPLNKTLADLGRDECRHIAGDPREGALYCGHPIFNRSFCAAHYARCYVAPEHRVRRAA